MSDGTAPSTNVNDFALQFQGPQDANAINDATAVAGSMVKLINTDTSQVMYRFIADAREICAKDATWQPAGGSFPLLA